MLIYESRITKTQETANSLCPSFDKIKNKLNFNISKTAEDGIDEILNKIKSGELDPKDGQFSNLAKAIEHVKVFKSNF